MTSEETVIVAGRLGRQYFQDLWHYRELFVFLAWRDLLVRYKQTVVGIAWAVIRPFATMLVLTLVFARLGNMPSKDTPYPLLVFCGILPWQFFATAISESGNSLVTNSALISKVYFPRLLIPASSLITALIDFLIALLFLAGLMAWYGWIPTINVLFLPAFAILASAVSLGLGIWVAALMVEYRDLRLVLPFLVQFGLYLSPVGFVSTVVPEHYRFLYSINPMVGVIDGFRWCVLGNDHLLHISSLAFSIFGALFCLVTGIWYFRRTERTFADVI